MKFTRGFSGRAHAERDPRLPPGQYDTGHSWPVLTAEVTPKLDTASWTFAIEGLVEKPTTWTWDEIHALPPSSYDGDIHCVTTWSKLGMQWSGVSIDTLLDIAHPLPTATHVLAFSHTGYTTNLPLADVTDGKAWVAWEADGEPLKRDHGGPARLLVPHLYFWKSAKWVAGLRVLDHDEPGFWERNGYHDRGDPWLEQRTPGSSSATKETERGEPGIPASSEGGPSAPAAKPPRAGSWRLSVRNPSAHQTAEVESRAVTTPWQTARVVSIRVETARTKTFRLALDEPARHRAGQHYVVRLTAPDGYTASRSYSVASAPDDSSNEFELTVERLEEGEVSTFLHDVVELGDELDVRGPIGGWFVWEGDTPALLVGGGSGVVPLMAMLRLARQTGRSDLVRVVVSTRSPDDLFFADELPGPETTIVYTRKVPSDWPRAAGRLMHDDVAPVLLPDVTAYVCGSTAFTNAASDLVVDLGVPVDRIRVERFGPTG